MIIPTALGAGQMDVKSGDRQSNTARTRAAGVVSQLELYSISEARARLDWSDSAFRSAKRQGLRVLTCGKRKYVSGKEIFRFLLSLPSNSKK